MKRKSAATPAFAARRSWPGALRTIGYVLRLRLFGASRGEASGSGDRRAVCLPSTPQGHVRRPHQRGDAEIRRLRPDARPAPASRAMRHAPDQAAQLTTMQIADSNAMDLAARVKEPALNSSDPGLLYEHGTSVLIRRAVRVCIPDSFLFSQLYSDGARTSPRHRWASRYLN